MDESQKWFQVYITVLEMLSDRGYDVRQQMDEAEPYKEDLENVNEIFETFDFQPDRAGIEENLHEVIYATEPLDPEHPQANLDPLKVYFVTSKSSLNKDFIKKLFERMKAPESAVTHAIIVYSGKMGLTQLQQR